MSVSTPHHRVARLITSRFPPDYDDFPSNVMEDEESLALPTPHSPIKIGRLVPSGTTQSWLFGRVTWSQKQQFITAQEYSHFVDHLLGERYPRDVVAFSCEHGLTDKLGLVVELINQAFPEAQSVTVGMEQDPESGHRWVMVDVRVHGSAKEVRQRHRQCVHRLLDLLPWPASTSIRTIYTLV